MVEPSTQRPRDAQPRPVVRIAIGRIEIRPPAVPAPTGAAAPPAAPAPPAVPVRSLEDYLHGDDGRPR
jgi:hypothetical protein